MASQNFFENFPLLEEEYAMGKVACLHLSYSNYESANTAEWPLYRQNQLKKAPFLELSIERPKDWYGAHPKLNGVTEDASKLKHLLEGKLAYKLFQFSELGKSETETKIDDFIATVNLPNSKYDAVMVFVSGHGDLKENKRVFYTEDGNTILVEDLISQLEECTHLGGKPKLVFIDTCQGEKEDQGDFAVVSKGGTDDEEEEDEEMLIRIPSGSDFLIAFANRKGFVAYESTWGGLFFGFFQRATLKYGHQMDLLGLLTITQNAVARITAAQITINTGEGKFVEKGQFVEEKGAKRKVLNAQNKRYKQMVNYYSSLRKFARFPIKGPAR